MSKFGTMLGGLKHKAAKTTEKATEKVKKPIEKPLEGLQKEAGMSKALHAEVMAALEQLKKKHPDIDKALEEAVGYAVIPSIGRASLVLGGAYGVGEVFVNDRVIGYAALIELTLGVQVGGTTFHELVIFRDEDTLKLFKAGKLAFAADAAVQMVKAGAQASKGFGGNSEIYVFTEGGMLLDLAIGVQKFVFKPAALGRLKTAKGAKKEEEAEEEEEDTDGEGVEAEAEDDDGAEAEAAEDEEGTEEEEERPAPKRKPRPAHHHHP